MQHAKVEEYIFESRKNLVKAGILKKDVLTKSVHHQSAHEAGNFDWRYLCAAQCFKTFNTAQTLPLTKLNCM